MDTRIHNSWGFFPPLEGRRVRRNMAITKTSSSSFLRFLLTSVADFYVTSYTTNSALCTSQYYIWSVVKLEFLSVCVTVIFISFIICKKCPFLKCLFVSFTDLTENRWTSGKFCRLWYNFRKFWNHSDSDWREKFQLSQRKIRKVLRDQCLY